MKPIFRLLLACAWLGAAWPAVAIEVGPDEVFDEVSKIAREVAILKYHFDITEEAQASREVKIPVGPGHTWQKTYEVLLKLNILRQKHGLSFNSIPSRAPVLNPPPMIVYEQARRILTEIEILKYHLGIMDQALPQAASSGKTVTDNFNLLNRISAELDLLNGSAFTPSYPFAQTMRISEDIRVILEALNLPDATIPPSKVPESKPADVFDTGLLLLAEISRVRQMAGLEVLDFSTLRPERTITPGDVFGLCMVILAELQPIKAKLGLNQALTPMANYYEGRVPADVRQVMGWSLRRMQLIRAFK